MPDASASSAVHPTTSDACLAQAAHGKRHSVLATGFTLTVEYTSRWAFHLSWMLIVLAHLGVAIAYKHEAYINSYILLGSKSEMALQLLGAGASIRPEIGNTLVGTNYVLMAWHIYGAAQAVLASLMNQRPVFRMQWKQLFLKLRPSSATQPTQPNDGRRVSSVSSITKARPTPGSVIIESLRRVWQLYRSTGAKGRYFDIAFDVREAFEIVSQTAQAYSITCLITNNSVLHFVSLVLVLNCWSTPLLRFVFHDDEAKKRLLCLAVDAVFDFCCALAIPFLTFALWDLQVDTIDFSDPVWLIRSSTLLRYNLVNSWSGVITTRLPALGLILALETMKSLLLRAGTGTIAATADLAEARRNKAHTSTPAIGPVTDNVPQKKASRVHNIVDVMFFIYGLVILILYTKAMAEPAIDHDAHSNCSLQLRPWGREEAQCAVVDIDCERLQIDGSASEIAAVINSFDTSVITCVTFANCKSFEMPPEVQNLPKLLQLVVFNSTLSRWDADAAVTSKHHPTLTSVSFILVTNLKHGIPAGLLSTDFPRSLCVVQIIGGDMETFVDGPSAAAIVANYWPKTMFVFSIERTSLREFPTSITDKTITQVLSLASNNLTSVPAEVFFSKRFRVQVFLGGNPLVTLPATAPSTTESRTFRVGLFLQNTSIQSIPSWLEQAYNQPPVSSIAAAGSPICTASSVPAPSYVNCAEALPAASYPLDEAIALRHRRAGKVSV